MNSSLFDSINQYSVKHSLLKPSSTIVVGLSGGPDSVFLLHTLHQLSKNQSLTLVAAHLDHEWRIESDKDAQFCQTLCESLGIRLITQKMSNLDLSIKFNGSKEELGRKARRLFFESVKKEVNADLIALAHHYDDQQETFFIRLLRGASLTGLTGMKPKQGNYIRPLLNISKHDILSCLHENNIAYLIDPSNSSPIYLRNRIRNNVLPALRDADTRFDVTFKLTFDRLAQADQFLQRHAEQQLTAISDASHSFSITRFLELDPLIQETMLIQWLVNHRVPFTPSSALLDEIVRFLKQPQGGTHSVHQDWKIVKQKGNASIRRIGT